MADNMNYRGSRDRDRVSGHQSYEVRHLCEKFGVEKQIVMDALRTCGNNRSEIEEYLKQRTGRGRTGGYDGARNAP